MPPTDAPPAPSFTRLRNMPGRPWGIRIVSGEDFTGQEITVTRQSDGQETRVRLIERVYTFAAIPDRPAASLYRFEDTAPRADATQAPADADNVLPTPVATNRTGRMLLAGGIHATVTHPDGQHTTLRVSSRRRVGRGYANCAPTDEGASVSIRIGDRRVGRILPGWQLQMFSVSQHVRNAVQVLFQVASGADVELIDGRLGLASGYRIQVADRCGRCHRQLTDPVSIDRGIGPECWGNSTGSRHAPVTGTATAPSPAVVAAPASDGQSLSARAFVDLLASGDIEDEADMAAAERAAAESTADAAPAFEAVGALTYSAADDTLTTDGATTAPLAGILDARPTPAPIQVVNGAPTTVAAPPAITGADIAQARNAMQAAFRSRTPRQLRALEVFDQLAARFGD